MSTNNSYSVIADGRLLDIRSVNRIKPFLSIGLQITDSHTNERVTAAPATFQVCMFSILLAISK
jgi:hypothetical protein